MYHVPYDLSEIFPEMTKRGMTKIFNTDLNSPSFFLKSILGGVFITVGMTGLDQEMMQKNISVKNLRDSQKNMMTFSITMAVVNFLFLVLGGLLYIFAESNGIKTANDDLFPTVALNYMPTALSIIFIIGLISALFPSADGALTALTSSYCIDILGLKRREELDEKARKKIRLTVHFTFAAIFFVMVMLFKWIDNKTIIDVILKWPDILMVHYLDYLPLASSLKERYTTSMHYLYALPRLCLFLASIMDLKRSSINSRSVTNF
jgi:Na+/proline symporter